MHIAAHVLVRTPEWIIVPKIAALDRQSERRDRAAGRASANIRVDPGFSGSRAEDFVPFARKPNCAALCVISAGNGVNAVKSGSGRDIIRTCADRSFVRSVVADASPLRVMTTSRANGRSFFPVSLISDDEHFFFPSPTAVGILPRLFTTLLSRALIC